MKTYYKNGLLLFTCLLTCLFVCCNKASGAGDDNTITDTTINPPSEDTTSYSLVWSDEFDSNAVNTNIWNFETGGSGWGNHEQEFYQQANASVENGNLIITAKKETIGSNGYTSSRMTTQGKREFKYGKMEACIKMPVGIGLWPAFWMLGSDVNTVSWPACGETDIMEHINADSMIYGTIHFDNNGHEQSGGKTTSSPSDYHVYAVEWNANTITWLIDNVQYYSAPVNSSNTEEFQRPFFILLNLAVGGDWPGQTIDDSKFPAKMYVDYVRVYQQ